MSRNGNRLDASKTGAVWEIRHETRGAIPDPQEHSEWPTPRM